VPEISRFFGIVIRMFFSEHNPPHVHAEYQGGKAVFDLSGKHHARKSEIANWP